jgi:aminoglycoside 6'-N-acetyltransferase I
LSDLPQNIVIRNIAPADAAVWQAMRTDLWPDGAGDHATEIAMFFAGTLEEPVAVLVAESVAGTILGFAELAVRNDLASLEGKNVGYVEGLYVSPEFRGHRIARKLLQASRSWAREQKCAGFASDRAGRIIIDPNF